jgi:hypothetical protein
MATRGANGGDHFGAEFISKLAQLVRGQFAQVGWDSDSVEQRGVGAFSH